MSARTDRSPPEHIGWDLWQASAAWKRRFTHDMVARGHHWYGEARGNLMQYLPPHGIAQASLATRTGLSKQAVQQLLDEWVDDGIVERRPDPRDARRKIIVYTPAGLAAVDDADDIKRRIEADYLDALGAPALKALKGALAAIVALDQA